MTSRLYRLAKPTSVARMFNIITERNGTLTDNQISSITLTRGADSATGGLNPSTLEFTTAGAVFGGNNSNINLEFTHDYAVWLAGQDPSGRAVAAAVRPRFTGRLATSAVEDKGGTRWNTTFQAVHWSSLVTQKRAAYKAYKGNSLSYLIKRALEDTNLTPARYSVQSLGDSDEILSDATDWISSSDIIDKYATGTGYQLRETRSGKIVLVPLAHRRAEGRTGVKYQFPLLRSEVIAPARWAQDVESVSTQLAITYGISRTEPTTYTQTWPLPDQSTPTALTVTEDVDWSNILTNGSGETAHYRHYMNARNAQLNGTRTSLRSVSINMARLVKSPVEYHRRIALQVLGMEVGEPLLLSGDWPQAVRGLHFAQQIKETVTADEWTVELFIHPASTVTGELWNERPPMPAYVWDQAATPWNTTPAAWDSTDLTVSY